MVCVANLLPNKGHRCLLEAFEDGYLKYNHMTLLLVGDGVQKNALIKQISAYRSKNNIKFLGKRSDVAKILSVSQIFVLPTLFEGMSNAIMEAMASRLAVVVSDIPENRELVKHGFNGLLFPVNNSRCLSNLISSVIDNPALRQALGNNAFNTIAANYKLERVVKLWEEYYEKF